MGWLGTKKAAAFQHFLLIPTPGCDFHAFPQGTKPNSEFRSCLNSLDFAAVHTNRSAGHPLCCGDTR